MTVVLKTLEEAKAYAENLCAEIAQRKRDRNRRWYQDHPAAKEEARVRASKWYYENPDRAKGHHLKRHYAMTLEQWNTLFEAQGRKCAICKIDEPPPAGGSWHVDHDHNKPKGEGNRGILCNNCNVLLGYAGERQEVLASAIDYLNKFKCVEAS